MSDQEIHPNSPSLSDSPLAESPPRAAQLSPSASATGSSRCTESVPLSRSETTAGLSSSAFVSYGPTLDSTSSKPNPPPSSASFVPLPASSGQQSGQSVFSLSGSSPFGRLPSASFAFNASHTSYVMRSEVPSSTKIPFAVPPSHRCDPSAGCADAWAPSPKDCSPSFDVRPPSLPPSPPASDGGDKEEGFDLF
jgi:hypothetical protein